ncbi:hypothetical protein MKW98_029758 [Papaver atlanticum]|uniref:NAD-dependent epimerase/dehydratase domain-containing protein n=1 Tax=Papaver atlanticum TaxID=357466 RepID=A0AAD4XPF4_9MAGN|nr:hypothetical protein MKW98_029758 [Papaver atlanticum]
MERENKGIVCVTGGAGYFASWLIKSLLEHGYTVRTTVRVRSDSGQVSHLKSLPEASGDKLQVFIADLERPESFDNVIDGCVGVFHVAHPMIDFTRKTEEPQEKTISTSVEGSVGVLKACLKSKTKDVEEINENMWSEVDTLRENGKWYPLSKTLTERAMFQFAEQHGLDLVSVLPSMIVGRFLSSSLPFSLKISQALVLGNKEHYNLLSTINNAVHIDDAASAHIFLFECSNAKGRYICSSADITIHDIAEFMSAKYPELQLPTELLMEIEEEKPIHLSSDKLLSCGFRLKYNLEDMYTDAIQCCKDMGFL